MPLAYSPWEKVFDIIPYSHHLFFDFWVTPIFKWRFTGTRKAKEQLWTLYYPFPIHWLELALAFLNFFQMTWFLFKGDPVAWRLRNCTPETMWWNVIEATCILMESYGCLAENIACLKKYVPLCQHGKKRGYVFSINNSKGVCK